MKLVKAVGLGLALVVALASCGSDGDNTAKPVAVDESHKATPKDNDVNRFISPAGKGNKSGQDRNNAAPLSEIADVAEGIKEGGQITLVAGEYKPKESITFDTGGIESQPLQIRGEDGVKIVGNRADPYNPKKEAGRSIFRLNRGADHVLFSNIDFANVGNGAFVIAGDVKDITIQDVEATNVRRFVEDEAKEGETASADGLVIRRSKIDGYSKGAIRLRYETRNVLIEDVSGDSQRQDGDNFAIGVHLADKVSDVVLRRVEMRNAQDTTEEYWNGDGFATERDVRKVVFEDATATGNTDAGFDVKSQETSLLRTDSADNKRNYRFWASDTKVSDCRSMDPSRRGGSGVSGHVQLNERAVVDMDECDFTGGQPTSAAFELDKNARVYASTLQLEIPGRTVAADVGARLVVDGKDIRD